MIADSIALRYRAITLTPLPTLPHVATATMHINYAEKIVVFKDGLPKFKDLPADLNGSGVELPEE